MKRPDAFDYSPEEFSAEVRLSIKRLVKVNASEFIHEMQKAAAVYRAYQSAEISQSDLRHIRGSLSSITSSLTTAASAIRTMDQDCRQSVGFAAAVLHPEEKDIDGHIAKVLGNLDQFERILRYAASMKHLNPPEGAPIDVNKLGLARSCADAYVLATRIDRARIPRSPHSQFARLLLIVMRAARAIPATQKTISKALLVKILSDM